MAAGFIDTFRMLFGWWSPHYQTPSASRYYDLGNFYIERTTNVSHNISTSYTNNRYIANSYTNNHYIGSND